MKKQLIFIYVMVCLINCQFGLSQTTAKISKKDFKTIVGTWQGTLTYLDYSSGKPYTMPANIEVKQIGKTGKFIFYNIYPDEPKANSADTTTLADDGKKIDDEAVKSVTKLANGDIEIITENTGEDGNDDKPAVFKYAYNIGKTTFKKKKEVQFIGQTEWIKRHEYNYTRK